MKYNEKNLIKEVPEMVNSTTLTDEELVSIAKHFDVDPEDIMELDYDIHGLRVLDIGGGEYIVAEDTDQAHDAAVESIKEEFEKMPTGFVPWALCDAMPDQISYESVIEMVEHYLGDLIKELVDTDMLAKICIKNDGYAPSLAHYDGDELEIGNLLLYRVN